ncbi:MAG: hypothetical protein K2Q12_09635 [Rickettsiales bacterium]|nr:hypothetical protein [Rickettsiales bacterium]
MKPNSQEQTTLIQLLDRIYGDIRAIESTYHIFGQEGDFRARIEYYHDAVRAVGQAEDDGLSKHSRLSAERLAYDVAMLRHIQAKPMTAGRGQQHHATSTALTRAGQPSAVAEPSREERQALKQRYKDYTVLFVALLAEKADRNAQTRTEDANVIVTDCATLKNLLAKLQRGEIALRDVMASVEHLEHDELRKALRTLLSMGKLNPKDVAQASGKLQDAQVAADAEIKKIDQAMHHFATAQLAVFEEAKDTVKSLASQGMNIAGKFVENAMRQAQGQGRGRF